MCISQLQLIELKCQLFLFRQGDGNLVVQLTIATLEAGDFLLVVGNGGSERGDFLGDTIDLVGKSDNLNLSATNYLFFLEPSNLLKLFDNVSIVTQVFFQ